MAVDREYDDQLFEAALVTRQIGSMAAIASASSLPESLVKRLPSARALIETVIRLFDIDGWAERAGWPLPLVTPEEVPDSIWPDETAVGLGPDDSASDPEQRLAADVAECLRMYGLLMGAVKRPEVRSNLRTARFQANAVALLSASGGWVIWARQNLPDDGGQGVDGALAVMLMAQAMFVLSVPYNRESELFPSLAFLRRYVADTDLVEWLVSHDAVVPHWVFEAGPEAV